jgi:hypothetical protein
MLFEPKRVRGLSFAAMPATAESRKQNSKPIRMAASLD